MVCGGGGGEGLVARPCVGGQVGAGGPFREGAADGGDGMGGGDGLSGPEGTVLVVLEPSAGNRVFDVGPLRMVGGNIGGPGVSVRIAGARGDDEEERERGCGEFTFHRQHLLNQILTGLIEHTKDGLHAKDGLQREGRV